MKFKKNIKINHHIVKLEIEEQEGRIITPRLIKAGFIESNWSEIYGKYLFIDLKGKYFKISSNEYNYSINKYHIISRLELEEIINNNYEI